MLRSTLLRSTMPFDPAVFLANAGTGRTIRRYISKQAVFSQGDRASAVFYVQVGRIRVSALSLRGRGVTLGILGPGNFLGEECLDSGQFVHTTSAVAMARSSILRIDKRTMLRTLGEERKMSDLFIAYMIRRHKHTQANMLGLLFYSSEQRLAQVLLMLAGAGKEDRFEVVIPRVSQETLAEMIGTTRSRVNFFMNKFRELGFIDYGGGHRGGLRVHSSLLGVVAQE